MITTYSTQSISELWNLASSCDQVVICVRFEFFQLYYVLYTLKVSCVLATPFLRSLGDTRKLSWSHAELWPSRCRPDEIPMYTYSYSVRREGEDCLEVSSALYACLSLHVAHCLCTLALPSWPTCLCLSCCDSHFKKLLIANTCRLHPPRYHSSTLWRPTNRLLILLFQSTQMNILATLLWGNSISPVCLRY